MKTRIISALVYLPIVLGMIYFSGVNGVVNVFVSLISIVAAYEGMKVSCNNQSKIITAVTMIIAATVPFMKYSVISEYLPIICFVYMLVLVSVMLAQHSKVGFENIAYSLLFGLVVPLAYSTLAFVRNERVDGMAYFMIVFLVCWFSDIGAYFTGSFLGKHKLAPVVSPKKTIEGAIGGYIFSFIAVVVFVMVYSKEGSPNYIACAVYAVLCSSLSIVGDLCTSILKRQKGVKNYGNIMPGHGGILDRFDSFLFVAPFVYLMSEYLHIIVI